MTTTTQPAFDAYLVGICHASVCSSLTPAETETQLNADHPTGIPSRWTLSTEPNFASGQANPCPCENSPETHKHYLFVC